MVRHGDPQPRSAIEPADVRFVLIEPQSPGNVGSAARALKNLGFGRLELVRPVGVRNDRRARMMAVDAADVLRSAGEHGDLDAALAGARTVIGTTGRTGKQRRPHWRLDVLAEAMAGLSVHGELAVVFGREDRGLTDDELDRCTHLVHLPAAAAYPSFNLAQAVLLVAYELRVAALPPAAVHDELPLADHESREGFYDHLEQALLAIGFVSEETRESIMRRMRRIFGRARLSTDDTQMLRGLARQILWAAAQAGSSPGEPDS